MRNEGRRKLTPENDVSIHSLLDSNLGTCNHCCLLHDLALGLLELRGSAFEGRLLNPVAGPSFTVTLAGGI